MSKHLVISLQEEVELLREREHKTANEFAVLLSQKERDFETKCLECRRRRL